MAYKVTRMRRGRPVEYWQECYREGGKPKTRYLGPVNRKRILLVVQMEVPLRLPGSIDMDAIEKQELARMAQEDARYKAGLEELHQQFGLKVGSSDPVPVSAPVAEVAPAKSDDAAAEAQESGDEGAEGR